MRETERTRRSLLRGAGIALGAGGLWGGTATAGARRRGRQPLIDGPAEFRVYVARPDGTPDDPDEPEDFGYPAAPTIASEDPVGGIFDAGDIEKTPNGRTLHHSLRFFQGLLTEDERGKPYVLGHDGDGRFTERGQHRNFTARSTAELKVLLGAVGLDPALADRDPLATLAGGTWRAVGNDVVQLLGDPTTSRRIHWALTRIDFYARGGGRPTPELSALYVIYPNVDENGAPAPADPANPTLTPIPTDARLAGEQLITDGRANLGGQQR